MSETSQPEHQPHQRQHREHREEHQAESHAPARAAKKEEKKEEEKYQDPYKQVINPLELPANPAAALHYLGHVELSEEAPMSDKRKEQAGKAIEAEAKKLEEAHKVAEEQMEAVKR